MARLPCTCTNLHLAIALCLLNLINYLLLADAAIVEHTFHVGNLSVQRLGQSQVITAVNGQFPGPKIEARDGDTVVVHVVNLSPYNLSIHWHGILQRLSSWADGPNMVSQCPIRPAGGTYTYRFNVTGQEGTLWWHAHVSFLRATVYGALILRPAAPRGRYPFPRPHGEATILLCEWWNASVVDVERQALLTGAGPNSSVALTINGLIGAGGGGGGAAAAENDAASSYQYQLTVEPGRTYLLRIINAAGRQPLLHRRRRRRLLHRPLPHRRHRHRAGPDGGRAHARRRPPGPPLLHGRTGVPEPRQRHLQRHHHGTPHLPPRRLGRRTAGAGAAGTDAYHAGVQRQHHRSELLREPHRAAAGRRADGAAARGHADAGHVRPGRHAVRAGADALQPNAGLRGGQHEQRLLPVPHGDVAAGGAHAGRAGRRVHARLPRPAAGHVRLHQRRHDGLQQVAHAHVQGHQGEDAAVQRDGGGGAAEHGHPGRREPPAAPPRLQLLRAGAGHWQLQRAQARPRIQPRQPAAAQHRRRPRRRLGRHPLHRRQSGRLDHALPPGGASAFRLGHGVRGGRRPHA